MAACATCHNEFSGTPWTIDRRQGSPTIGQRIHVDCGAQAPPKPRLGPGEVGASAPFASRAEVSKYVETNHGRPSPRIAAKHPGTCPACGARYRRGAPIAKIGRRWGHAQCAL